MKKIIVFVTGYEGNESTAISGWDWYFKKEDADVKTAEYKDWAKDKPKILLYSGECEVEVENTEDIEEITGAVELFLGENDWENAFKKL